MIVGFTNSSLRRHPWQYAESSGVPNVAVVRVCPQIAPGLRETCRCTPPDGTDEPLYAGTTVLLGGRTMRLRDLENLSVCCVVQVRAPSMTADVAPRAANHSAHVPAGIQSSGGRFIGRL